LNPSCPGKEKFRVTTQSIHKLIMVVPVEEQTFDDEVGIMGTEEDNEKPDPKG
jgi:hypothetical protein